MAVKLPPPVWVGDRNLNTESSLLAVFPLRRQDCISCGLDYLWQAYGLGGGRCSFFCSDRCAAITYAARAAPKDATP
jgi:hypothetical protein